MGAVGGGIREGFLISAALSCLEFVVALTCGSTSCVCLSACNTALVHLPCERVFALTSEHDFITTVPQLPTAPGRYSLSIQPHHLGLALITLQLQQAIVSPNYDNRSKKQRCQTRRRLLLSLGLRVECMYLPSRIFISTNLCLKVRAATIEQEVGVALPSMFSKTVEDDDAVIERW